MDEEDLNAFLENISTSITCSKDVIKVYGGGKLIARFPPLPSWQIYLSSVLRQRLPFLNSKRRMIFFGVDDQNTFPDHIPLYGGKIYRLFNASAYMMINKELCETLINVLEKTDLTPYLEHDVRWEKMDEYARKLYWAHLNNNDDIK
jgi:hypothetical protein